jgi:hypothetical protein
MAGGIPGVHSDPDILGEHPFLSARVCQSGRCSITWNTADRWESSWTTFLRSKRLWRWACLNT